MTLPSAIINIQIISLYSPSRLSTLLRWTRKLVKLSLFSNPRLLSIPPRVNLVTFPWQSYPRRFPHPQYELVEIMGKHAMICLVLRLEIAPARPQTRTQRRLFSSDYFLSIILKNFVLEPRSSESSTFEIGQYCLPFLYPSFNKFVETSSLILSGGLAKFYGQMTPVVRHWDPGIYVGVSNTRSIAWRSNFLCSDHILR